MNIASINRLKATIVLLILCGLTACGGGGAQGNTAGSSATISDSATVNTNTIVMSDAQTAQIVSTAKNADGSTQLVTTANSTFGATLTVGKVVFVAGGTDTRFPLGLAGKVTSVATNSDGSTTAVLTNATLADVVQKSSFQQNEVPLDSTNFVGVITPRAVQASSATRPQPLSVLRQGIAALNGGLILSEPNSLGRIASSVQNKLSFLGGSGTIDAKEIKLDFVLKLANMVDPTRLRPYGTGAEASIDVTGAVKNLKLIENHDFDTTGLGIVTGLKSMDMRVTGDIDLAVNLHGGVDADFGYFSQAWKEVEDEQFKVLGASAKLTGLDSKEKIGKYPLAGLVFSIPCPPPGCQILDGQTQTPLRAAKAGGVIVWIYITANGKIVLDGKVGARLNMVHLDLGAQKSEGGKLNAIHKLSNTGKGPVIEAPYFDGKVGAKLRLGPAFDVDIFVFGVHVINASVFIGGQDNATVKTVTPISYGTAKLGDPWTWDGKACMQSSISAGAIFSLGAEFGVELDTRLGKISATKTYSDNWPTEGEMLNPGWHDAWYTGNKSSICLPAPMVTKVITKQDVSARTVDILINGTNLPDDLQLDVSPTATCTGLKKTVTSDTSTSFTCQIAVAVTHLVYNLTSQKAQNIDLSKVGNELNYTPISSVPSHITTTADDGRVIINWNTIAGVTYNLYMASVSGITKINYSSLADGVMHSGVTPPYTQTGLANGKTYYFVVTAVNTSGESMESIESAATPRSILNDRVLMLTQHDVDWEIYSVGIDGSNPINLTNNSADDRLPALSPERGRIAFVSDRDGNNEIYTMTSDGAIPARLTNNAADDVTPVWSPDGNKIAFVSKRDGNYEIYVMNSDGQNQLRLTNSAAEDVFPSWSPDSKKIVFVTKRDNNEEIYIINADGSGSPVNLTNDSASDTIPFFSPDGAWISFISDRDGAGYDLWIMDTNGANLRKITTMLSNDIGWYALSPDGSQVAFDSKADGDYEIYVINFDGTNLMQLTDNTVNDQFSTWTWNGQKIVFLSNRSGSNQIYAMDPNGGNPVNVSNDTASVALPAASPIYGTGGGCFIATAAYGSFLEPEVVVLRDFRDRYLLTSNVGRVFVTYYYKWSPPVADFIRMHKVIRIVVRIGLTPLIYGIKYPEGAGLILVLLALSFSFQMGRGKR